MPVYMIRAGGNGPVKIGHSHDPFVRLVQLQISHWEVLTIIRLFEGAEAEEGVLHAKFSDLHIRGEWHHFSRALLGDLGLVEISVASLRPGPKLNSINPITGKVGREWTKEERAACAARQLAISADPVRREARMAKLRKTLARKALLQARAA